MTYLFLILPKIPMGGKPRKEEMVAMMACLFPFLMTVVEEEMSTLLYLMSVAITALLLFPMTAVEEEMLMLPYLKSMTPIMVAARSMTLMVVFPEAVI